jgi:hypothetical protein
MYLLQANTCVGSQEKPISRSNGYPVRDYPKARYVVKSDPTALCSVPLRRGMGVAQWNYGKWEGPESVMAAPALRFVLGPVQG